MSERKTCITCQHLAVDCFGSTHASSNHLANVTVCRLQNSLNVLNALRGLVGDRPLDKLSTCIGGNLASDPDLSRGLDSLTVWTGGYADMSISNTCQLRLREKIDLRGQASFVKTVAMPDDILADIRWKWRGRYSCIVTALGHCKENLASLETLSMSDGAKFMSWSAHALPSGNYSGKSTKFQHLLT
jgi:hypothetical protein